MHTEKITTESGTTILSSNDRYYGPRNLPLLYLHGGPGSPRLEAVDQIDYDGPVFTYAQFGCGGSDSKGEYTPELFVQQLHEIIEEVFNGGDLVLMGGSWGGGLALLYIEKYGTEHISGLILSSPIINAHDNALTNEKRMSDLPEDIRETILKGNREGFFGETYCLAQRAFYKDYYGGRVSEHMADWCFEPSNDVYVQMWGKDESACTGNTKDLCLDGMLDRIDIPVLYISGDRDLHSVEDVRRYCSRIKDVELHVLEGTGHFSNSHPDYDSIVREFIHRVDRTPPAASDEDGFRYQEDYDMIISDSPHDTPEHLRYAASKMSIEEAAEEARRYETGDGRPQSYLSASIFYGRCREGWDAEWSVPHGFPFCRQYDARDAERRLILAAGNIASFCCKKMKEEYGGSTIWNGVGSIRTRHNGSNLKACPFCGRELETIDVTDDDRIDIGSDEEFLRLKDRYQNGPMGIREALAIGDALRRYSERKRNDCQYHARYYEASEKHRSVAGERIGNVTGRLTASSAGLESVCCRELSENMILSSSKRDMYYMRIQLKDSGKRMELKVCPYCGARLKRVPRTY